MAYVGLAEELGIELRSESIRVLILIELSYFLLSLLLSPIARLDILLRSLS
jgi:hypothetical protein